ncbi:hypothetical protein BC830DRAFT_1168621 [Chytriomyces sp. MP71]|nr:hypothetical protein BC830DRAFT_1168621 [Chytriomyces sp. MP71]
MRRSSEQWLHQFTSSPVVHAKSGVTWVSHPLTMASVNAASQNPSSRLFAPFTRLHCGRDACSTRSDASTSRITGPTLTHEVSVELRDWLADHASAQTRFGVVDMIRRAKVETIVGKLGVLCIKTMAQGHGDRGIVAVVERKLVTDVVDALEALNQLKK